MLAPTATGQAVWHTCRMPKKASDPNADSPAAPSGRDDTPAGADDNSSTPGEIGGRDGPDPTRYGDWEKAGRCIDF